MNARVVTATRLGFLEQARRPLLLVLLVVLPFFFITRAIARTEPTPRLIGLPGGGEVLTTMKDVHACVGALTGALLGQLGATYLVLFGAMLGIGILQNPMFGDGTPGGLAYVFPDYGAGRIVIDGAFSAGFHAWSELALALGWLALVGLTVAWVLRRLLGSAN